MKVTPDQNCGWVFDVEAEMKETSLYQIRLWNQEMSPEILEEESSKIGSDIGASAAEMNFVIHYLQIVRDLRSVDEAKLLIEWLSEKTGIAAAAPPGETTVSATGPD